VGFLFAEIEKPLWIAKVVSFISFISHLLSLEAIISLASCQFIIKFNACSEFYIGALIQILKLIFDTDHF